MEDSRVILSWDEITNKALGFSKRWINGGNEKSEGQSFVRDFLGVFGVTDPLAVGMFEESTIRESGKGFMDYLWKGKIAIEMKSKGKNLVDAFTQLKDYVFHLPADEMPNLLMVSDFQNIVILRRTTEERVKFKTKYLHKHIKLFADIAGYEITRVYENQIEVNVQAAEKMAKLHDALKDHGYEGHGLEVYLVRLLFCLFAEDTGIFQSGSFTNFIENSKPDGSDLSERIGKLFEILNMSPEIRNKRTLIRQDLLQFCYVNSRLFADYLETVEFDAKMRRTLLHCATFDWSMISPAVFGAMFQGIMNAKDRREMGAHYTSEENILKIINPLFMDGLWEEFEQVKANKRALEIFHDKLANMTFLDPACGCGNFLIITYRELRLLELEIIKMLRDFGFPMISISLFLRVSVSQFYGIDYEDFPCQIAQVGMWLIDHQMNIKASEMFGTYYIRMPLKQSATIVNANALRIDWEIVVPKSRLSYILGNPPFVGHQLRNPEQAEDMELVFADESAYGKLDYVCSWYYKSAQFMKGTRIQAAFVSTNSIVQGESVGLLWKPLFSMGMEITFACRSFKWSNDAKGKATVHCVIIGFAETGIVEKKFLYNTDGSFTQVNFINGYLADAPSVFLQSRGKPIVKGLPQIIKGSQPTDGG
ncbi:MAG: class I SAM-dependent DNA methyltransferase, partial [Deltaproteobacteria bacterium]|nr:class I SAM-dependent DNA methyltransferase [Deltaproteobacteria bacterium]